MDISEKIYRLRTENGLKQHEFAKIAGVSEKSVSAWENGTRSPKLPPMKRICDYFGLDFIAFVDENSGYYTNIYTNIPPGFEPLPRTVKKPLIGNIACGAPITAEECIEGYVDVPENVHCDFCLRCKGDSMIEAGIHDGDVVYIRKQPMVDGGEIAAVRIDNEATLKRVFWDEEQQILQLIPCNKNMPSKVFSGSILETVQIEGKAVGFTHIF